MYVQASENRRSGLSAGRDRQGHVLDVGNPTRGEQSVAVLATFGQPAGRGVERGEAAAFGDHLGLIGAQAARSVPVDFLQRQHVGAQSAARARQDVGIARPVGAQTVLDVERCHSHDNQPRGEHVEPTPHPRLRTPIRGQVRP